MPFSRLSFAIQRIAQFPESALLVLLLSPARLHGLRGRVEVAGPDSYTVVVEGEDTDVTGYKTYVVDYLEVVVGEVTELVQTDDLTSLVLPFGVRIIMPE